MLNLTALAFCFYLLVKGKVFPETGNDPLQNFDNKPWPYIFYRGVELHPRIFDADVKQVTGFFLAFSGNFWLFFLVNDEWAQKCCIRVM